MVIFMNIYVTNVYCSLTMLSLIYNISFLQQSLDILFIVKFENVSMKK